MEGSPLRNALKTLIAQTVAELNQQTVQNQPEEGVVLSINASSTNQDDPVNGTVVVQTSSGVYGTVGAAVQFTVGAQVLVLTGDGRKVAIPR